MWGFFKGELYIINNWIYHCYFYQSSHLSLKMRTPITYASYFNCIETKQDWWRSFREPKIYLNFLLLTIYLCNKYIMATKVNIYAQTMAHLHSGATL